MRVKLLLDAGADVEAKGNVCGDESWPLGGCGRPGGGGMSMNLTRISPHHPQAGETCSLPGGGEGPPGMHRASEGGD